MKNLQIKLEPLHPNDREQFILDNQKAFKYGALEEFGVRDEHFEEDGEIISRTTIERSIDNGTAYRIVKDNNNVGGLVVKDDETDGRKNEALSARNFLTTSSSYAPIPSKCSHQIVPPL